MECEALSKLQDKCKHDIVLEIYTDSTHKEISHYFCVGCCKKAIQRFGINIVSEMRFRMLKNLK